MKMCRKVELLDKRMMLGVVVTQIVPQIVQFQQLHQHQIEVDSLTDGAVLASRECDGIMEEDGTD